MREHPLVDFNIDFSDRKVDLIVEGMDLAIRIGNLSDTNLIARKIAAISTAATASPAYLQDYGTPKKPDDLKEHKKLRYGYRSTTSWSYKGPDGVEGHIEMTSRLRATNGEFLRDIAVAGEGILIEPRFIIYENLRVGSLVEILPDYQWPQITAYAV